MMNRVHRVPARRALPAPLAALLLCACQPQLMPTPNIYSTGRYELFEDVAPPLRSSGVDILYVTDRGPIEKKGELAGYGYERCRSVAFGSCTVEIGKGLTWDELLQESTAPRRSKSLPLHVRQVNEMGRLPETPWLMTDQDGRLVDDPATVARSNEVGQRFGDELRRRLALTPSKDVFIYVHGFHNSFEQSVEIIAEFWHFGGRVGVPIVYSWPAGSPGLLRGYNHDRESGEFTIHHLKRFLRLVASVPEVQRIQIIGHSRGTDVITTALRELLFEDTGAGRDTRQTLRIDNVVLASPDLDLDVFFQRFPAERFFHVARHLTIYVSAKDKAIGMAQWLYRSHRRVGDVEPEDFSADEEELLTRIGAYDIVDAKVKTGALGHSYYHSNPAVSSDLLLLLRYGARAGSPQRPLKQVIPGYWVLDSDDYPFDSAPAE
jgi:esterase/lipase superfamily enzyme